MKSNIGTGAYVTMKYENLLGNGFDEIIEFILGSKYCYKINDQNISLIISEIYIEGFAHLDSKRAKISLF